MSDESQFTRVYYGDGYIVKARPNSCFFCEHLTDIIWDYENGPYILHCEKFPPSNSDEVIAGLEGKCGCFKEGGYDA